MQEKSSQQLRTSHEPTRFCVCVHPSVSYVHVSKYMRLYLAESLALAVARNDRRWRFASAITAWLPDAAASAWAGTSSSFHDVSSHWSTFFGFEIHRNAIFFLNTTSRD